MTTDFVCEEKHYILVPEEEEQQCYGCAFEVDHQKCLKSPPCTGELGSFIWIEYENRTGT